MHQINQSEVHLWRIDLDQPSGRLQDCTSILSKGELVRAEKFAQPLHRGRFIFGHAAIRRILAKYLDCAPERLLFETGKYGKPGIGSDNSLDIQFNYSHSQDLGVLAVTKGLPVGVDVEYIRPINDALQLAERFFTRAEVDLLRSVPENQFLKSFYTLWTCKEAFIKSVGMGMAYSLNAVEILFNNENIPYFSQIKEEYGKAEFWKLKVYNPVHDFLCASVVKSLFFNQIHWKHYPLLEHIPVIRKTNQAMS